MEEEFNYNDFAYELKDRDPSIKQKFINSVNTYLILDSDDNLDCFLSRIMQD